MKVTYSPAGEAVRTWEFKPNSVREAKAEMIETRAGKRFGEWFDDLLHGGARARRVLLWHLLTTHEHAGMRFDDVDFARDELVIEPDADELRRMREGIEEAKGVSESDRADALAEIDAQIAKLGGEGESGKASSPTSEPVTA